MDEVVDEVDELDIDALHRAVLREREEPSEGREPVPIPMVVAAVLLIAWGGWFLGRYDAKFDHNVIDGNLPRVAEVSGGSAGAAGPSSSGSGGGASGGTASAEPVDMATLGENTFASRCVACHQANGQGMPMVAPTLDGSEWVNEDSERLIKVVMHGLQGPITVKGQPFNGAMPGWGASMSDEELAAVLTYVRRSWTNDSGPITVEEVSAVRTNVQRSTPWTAEEL